MRLTPGEIVQFVTMLFLYNAGVSVLRWSLYLLAFVVALTVLAIGLSPVIAFIVWITL